MIWEVEKIPWIWGSVLRAQDRLSDGSANSDGMHRCWIDKGLFTIRLRQVYEYQLKSELAEFEWPSGYWEQREESMRSTNGE